MIEKNKAIIKSGLISGIVFAGLMAVFEHFGGKDFSLWRFIFYLFFFGAFMGIVIRFILKKHVEKENKTD